MPFIPPRQFANVENILIQYYRALYSTSAVPRVCSELPAETSAVLPVIQITRTSGFDDDKWMSTDDAIVDISVFAATRTDAAALSDAIRSNLKSTLQGSKIGNSGSVLVYAKTIVGPRWLPDPDNNLRRYSATYQLGIRTFG